MQVLENLGFTGSEVKVYMALLELGSSTTGPIIEKSGIASSKVYEILDKLIDKGLVSFVHKGRIKYFESAPPSRIMDFIQEKEKQLTLQKQEVQNLLPELELLRQMSKHQQDAEIFRGFQGLETAFMDALDSMPEGSEILVSGVSGRSPGANRFFLRWNAKRAAKNVTMKILFDETARGEPQTIPKNSPKSEIKFMPPSIRTPAAVNIFQDRVIVFPAEAQKDPLLIVLHSKDIADSFRTQFELQWSSHSTIIEGIEGPRMAYKMVAESDGEGLAFGLDYEMLNTFFKEETTELVRRLDERKKQERIIVYGDTKEYPVGKHTTVRNISEKYFSPLHVEIISDAVIMIDWTQPITTIILNKKEIVDSYRKYFNLLWSIAEPVN